MAGDPNSLTLTLCLTLTLTLSLTLTLTLTLTQVGHAVDSPEETISEVRRLFL